MERPLYWAAAFHRIGPVALISVANTGTTFERDLLVELTCEPPFLEPARFALNGIPPGDEAVVRDPHLAPDLTRLRDLVEAERATVRLRLLRGSAELAMTSAPLVVLAHNEWDARDRRLLGAFVMPNHPAITELVAEARTLQEQEFGRSELEGYQAGDRTRVTQQTAAVYGAIQRAGITYLGMPASFEAGGQKLRSADALRAEKQGNCIEVATWFAAALEACGLHPVVILLKGHAFAGVWLTDEPRSMDTIETDAAAVRKLQQTGRLLLVETTAATTRPAVPFAQACDDGVSKVLDTTFQEMLDVHGLRVAGVRPLNVAAAAAGTTTGSPVAAPDLALPPAPEVPLPPSPRSKTSRRRFDVWVDELMDLSLRNDLIGGTMVEAPAAFRGLRPKKGLALAVPDLAVFENDLEDGRSFELITDTAPLPDAGDRSAQRIIEERLGELQQRRAVVVDPGADALPEKLRKIWKKHRQLVEEKGASSLHVALGYLRWFESDASSQPRYAPLLLVPAHLERVSLQGEFTLAAAEGDTVLNAAMVQKLKREFAVDLSVLAAELPEDDYGIDVAALFAQVTQAVMKLRRFEVVPVATLGFFEYRKQLMARDLRAMLDSGDSAPNAFVASLVPELAADGGYQYADGTGGWQFPSASALDDRPAGELPLVVDSDSSQLGAVQAAMEGRSFVLQGPPGTGKSQTITNMVACLLAAGKRVLFVAEKRAALSVVAKRLAGAGLRTACLELHGDKPDPGAVARSLAEALDGERPGDASEFARCAAEVHETRARLNAFVRRLHHPAPLGMSFFRASARRHELRDQPTIVVAPEGVLDTTGDALTARLRALGELERAIADCDGWGGHPFRASRLDSWTERRQDLAKSALKTLVDTARAARAALDDSARTLGIEPGAGACDPDTVVQMLSLLGEAPPPWVRELSTLAHRDDYLAALDDLCAIATRRAARLSALTARWTDGLHDLDLGALVASLRTARTKGALARWWALRAPRKTLRGVARGQLGDIDSLLTDLDEAVAARNDSRALDGASQAVAQLMGPAFVGARTEAAAFGRAQAARRWSELTARLAASNTAPRDVTLDAGLAMPALDPADAVRRASELTTALAAVRQAADAAVETLVLRRSEAFGDEDPARRLVEVESFAQAALTAAARLRDKTASERAAGAAEAVGAGEAVSALRAGQVGEDAIVRTYEASFLKTWVAEATDAHPELASFRGREHDRVIEAFRRADRALLDVGKRRALFEVASRRPSPGVAAHAQSEVGILRREAMKSRRRMPVRRLLAALPTVVPRLKPCFLMSPLAVAHFLPVDVEKFDTVIFDEASQVPTADAVGALWRGRQVIVVGDSKQMPPTDFFTASFEEDEDDDGGIPQRLDSILDEAVASGIPALMLAWHYRSRDERLIAFSNRQYYESRLLTFPAADPEWEGCGVFFERVPGVFDRGASRRNEIEAHRVVDLIVERLRDPARRDRSIGVVTFNVQQQDLIETLLDRRRQEHPEIERYFTDAAPEPVFVKNLESVQGDERDVMIFSTTYGRDAAGRTSVNFGPMNRTGGERRLNVAITRARERLIVVSSMDPEEIDLGRTGAVGVAHFRDFLRYARDGVKALFDAVRIDPMADCESPFERDVLEVCEGLGWRMDRQVGCSGYRIDLAVGDPRFPGRHLLGIECDGATYHSAATARDRDRLRQAVLENLGWALHRIWSTDWRVDRAGEIARLQRAYDAALASARRAPGNGANTSLVSLAPPAGAPSLQVRQAPANAAIAASRPALREPVDPATVTDAQRRDALLRALQEAGAMPRDALIKDAAVRVGHQRVGSRIRSTFEALIERLLAEGTIRTLGDRIAPPG